MRTLALIVGLLVAATPAQAGFGGRAAQELAEFVMKKFGRQAAQEGAERLASKLATAVARHGDDLAAAVRKVGPKAITLADDAGANAPSVIRLLTHYGDDAARILSQPRGLALVSRYGDDAAKVMIRHKGVAEPVVEALGQPAIHALGAVGPQAGRRLAMMTQEIAAGGRAAELLDVVARHGDGAMDFIWRHKGVLAGTAALSAFLANPEPYLNGTADLARAGMEGASHIADTVADNAVKPAVAAVGNAAVKTADAFGQVMLVGMVGLAVLVGVAATSGFFKSLPFRVALRVAGRLLGSQVKSVVTGGK